MANPITFRRNLDVGAADAESDDLYLSNCFQDTGDLRTLTDCSNAKCLVLGRTGTGKTALLKQILKGPFAVELSPEDLALNYITNSQVIKFFEAAGVRLDVFYTLLWRHIITVELLRLKYGITNQERQVGFLVKIGQVLGRNETKKKALKYLSDWGSHFWEETEYRTKEFVRKLETDLKGSVKLGAQYIALGAEGARKLSEEEKVEVINHGTRVVNEVQVKELHDVISLLSEDIFTDPLQSHYVIIDRLDEEWVDDSIRFKLIKALIETLRTFKRVTRVKIIVALRTDLHFRVLRETPQHGFQEEKYRSLYLELKWTRQQLERMLTDRVAFMFRRQYTREGVKLTDILASNQIEHRTLAEYMIDRTFFRPREAIIFLNECLAKAEGKSKITIGILKQAEITYSQQRFVSLADEWRREYPNLQKAAQALLTKRLTPFMPTDVTTDDCERVSLAVLEGTHEDALRRCCEAHYLISKTSAFEFAQCILAIFYQVGLVGVKAEAHLSRLWSFMDEPVLEQSHIHEKSIIDVHKTFWAALGVTTRDKRAA
jgi:hypothetical protein